MTAYRIRYTDWGSVEMTEFSYERKTSAYYMGAKVVRQILGHGYIPFSGRVPLVDARETLTEACQSLIDQARNHMEVLVNKINSTIGELQAMLNREAA